MSTRKARRAVPAIAAGAAVRLLSPAEFELLRELFVQQGQERLGVNAKRFRASRGKNLSLIDDLVATAWIQQRADSYFVSLAGVAELAPTVAAAESLLFLLGHIFAVLRSLYESDPDKRHARDALVAAIDMPLGQVKSAFPYLSQALLFSTHSTDFDKPDAWVELSENVIRHSSFEEIVQQNQTQARARWLANRPAARAARQPSGTPRPAKARTHAKTSLFRTPLETYTRIEQIGQGGSGFVVSAKDEDGREVAIKYLDPKKRSKTADARFRNEIRFGQRAAHPNIVPVQDVGEIEIEGQPSLFFVMPLYPLTLRAALAGEMIAPHQVPVIFEHLLNGVEAAHRQGVWHRDLKPENVFLSRELGEVRIGDFGIAHFTEKELYAAAKTRKEDRLANFRYAAPEQRDPNAPKDHRVDIFALGLMLNEMFTGQVPHGSDYEQIAAEHPAYAHLDALVRSMTQQKAAERPDSIDAIRKRLRPQAAHESSTTFFTKRFANAFPGVRGIKTLTSPGEALTRLRLLLQEPLKLGTSAPIWWWRDGNLQIEQASVLDDRTLLLDGQELIIDWIAAVNSGAYYQQFVYLQTLPSKPSGLYDYSYIDRAVADRGYAREEFAIYKGRLVTLAEHDDGAAVIDGMPVRFEEPAHSRVRYLSPYNLVIAPFDSPINNDEFDSALTHLMNGLLRKEVQLTELVNAVLQLPKRQTHRG